MSRFSAPEGRVLYHWGGCPGSVNQEEGAAPGWPIDVPLALHGCMGARLLGSFVGDYQMGSKDRCQND